MVIVHPRMVIVKKKSKAHPSVSIVIKAFARDRCILDIYPSLVIVHPRMVIITPRMVIITPRMVIVHPRMVIVSRNFPFIINKLRHSK